jgi:hypothetical protein
MNLGFTQLINAIESEIKTDYLPGAIRWSDEKFGNAWTRAMDRFDKALAIAIDRGDYRLAQIEGDFYKATVLDLLGRYRNHKNLDATDSFLSALERRR